MRKQQKERHIELDRLRVKLNGMIEKVESKKLRVNLYGKLTCIFFGTMDSSYISIRKLEQIKNECRGFENALDCILMTEGEE
jgi:hypothetical protein